MIAVLGTQRMHEPFANYSRSRLSLSATDSPAAADPRDPLVVEFEPAGRLRHSNVSGECVIAVPAANWRAKWSMSAIHRRVRRSSKLTGLVAPRAASDRRLLRQS